MAANQNLQRDCENSRFVPKFRKPQRGGIAIGQGNALGKPALGDKPGKGAPNRGLTAVGPNARVPFDCAAIEAPFQHAGLRNG